MNAVMRGSLAVGFCCACLMAQAGLPTKIATTAIEEALDRAAKVSGRTLQTPAVRKAATQELATLAAKHGAGTLEAVGEGGLELLQSAKRYGDEVVVVASGASAAGRRALALNTAELLPLVKSVGVEALEAEAKAPGQASTLFRVFGPDLGRTIATAVPAEDLPRLIRYGEKATSADVPPRLLEVYSKEKGALFTRIPPSLVLSSGLTMALLDAGHRATAPWQAVADVLRHHPEMVLQVTRHATMTVGVIVALVLVLLLWRFGWMPWHRPASTGRVVRKMDGPA